MERIGYKRTNRREKRTGTFFTKERSILAKEFIEKTMEGDIDSSIDFLNLMNEQLIEDDEKVWKKIPEEQRAKYLLEKQNKSKTLSELTKKTMEGDIDSAIEFLSLLQK